MTEAAENRRRVGRPRLRPASRVGLSAREEIIGASASLFVTQGLASTTTRQIAERVGIQQASLYYYFNGKDEILLELLTRSVRPSLEVARFLESQCGADSAAGLYALAFIDVRTLAEAPHNIGMLYLLPEVQGPQFASFRAERESLEAVYARLAGTASALPGPGRELIGTLTMQLVESVINLRRTGRLRDDADHEIAAACLRLAGLPSDEVARAREAAATILAALVP